MKKIIVSFLVTSLSLLGTEDKQVTIKSLQKRGEDGNQLYYLPNQEVPFTGKAVDYWPSGQKMTEISYKDGKLHGLKSDWYYNGQKLMEINYKHGKFHGLWTDWNMNGTKRFRNTWKDGKKDGLQTEWYKNGQKRLQRIFKGGLTESAMVWKPDGEKCSMTDVKAGNGIMSKYWDDGAEWLRITYKDGHMTHCTTVYSHTPPSDMDHLTLE